MPEDSRKIQKEPFDKRFLIIVSFDVDKMPVKRIKDRGKKSLRNTCEMDQERPVKTEKILLILIRALCRAKHTFCKRFLILVTLDVDKTPANSITDRNSVCMELSRRCEHTIPFFFV